MPTNLVVLLVTLLSATAVGLGLRRYNGHFRGAATSVSADASDPDSAQRERVDAADLAVPLGDKATLLQFSSAFCAPCRATKRVLADVAGMVPGVVHVEIDAEHHLELVRRLGVMRTPTTFVLDASGAIITRASGQPRTADVIAALGKIA